MPFVKTLEGMMRSCIRTEACQVGGSICRLTIISCTCFSSIQRDPMPVNTYNATTKLGVAYQCFSQYQHYLDLVRNEKPILYVQN